MTGSLTRGGLVTGMGVFGQTLLPTASSSPSHRQTTTPPQIGSEMVVFIEPDDELLEPIDIETRTAWIEAAVAHLHPLISQATFETYKDDRGRELPVPPARDILRRAVAAQIIAWWRWEVDPTVSATRVKSSVTLGPATVSYDHRDDHATQFARIRDGVDPTALSLIRAITKQPNY